VHVGIRESGEWLVVSEGKHGVIPRRNVRRSSSDEMKKTRRARKEVLETADVAREYALGVCAGQGSPLDSSRGERGCPGNTTGMQKAHIIGPAQKNSAQETSIIPHCYGVSR
jgi:hypothetical protein